MSTKIDELLDDVVTLPSLPSTVAYITGLVNDPNATVQEIGKAITADTALALKTLRLVNSAYYGIRDSVTSVEHAAALLGMKVIKNLVFTAAVFDTLQFSEERLLRHNVACGTAMKHLVESNTTPNVGIEHPDEAFIYGLLHDAGKIILHQFMPDDTRNVMHTCSSRQISASEAEQEVIGADHAEIGARLARKWKLSDELVDGIAAHHDLSKCDHPEYRGIAALMSVADYACYQADMPAHDSVPVNIAQEMWDETGVTPETLQPTIDYLVESAESIDELVNISA